MMKNILFSLILFSSVYAQDCKECYYRSLFSGFNYVVNIEPEEECNRYFFFVYTGESLDNCNVLPIELNYFKADLINDKVIIEWQTLTEINNDYFEVLKSYNGVDWFTLTTVNGSGNSNNIIKYNYIDDDVSNEIIYYQLKQIDYNGASEYFNIIKVEAGINLKYKYYDVNGREVKEDFIGIKIKYYYK